MDEQTKQWLKLAAVAVAGYMVYNWLKANGYLGGTVAPANQFSDPTALLSYCQANPTGTAVFLNPTTGATSTAPCSQWIASNSSSTATQATPVTTTTSSNSPMMSALPANYQQAVTAMIQAAGSNLQSNDIWSYYWQNNPTFSGAPAGYGVSGSVTPQQMSSIQAAGNNNPSGLVSAEQFVTWLMASPTTGMQGIETVYDTSAYEWVN